ncbi:unnamed protein product [Paramecium primaurelia]|uniref:ERV/ALR sulfhydryl oxidase domain-containing protein n=1 Tax=Paramecium primaurelia TaxID=5886 RepID=A0A8S1L388_PARPR|nr:unnamed protein product [Paramecium primaurelia]
MQKPQIMIVDVYLFFITLFLINTIHQYDQNTLINTEIPFPWEINQPDEEHLKILDQNETDLIEGYSLTIKPKQKRKFSNGITREELGQVGWTRLHMISAILPVNFDEEFTFKINAFSNLLQMKNVIFMDNSLLRVCWTFYNLTIILPNEGSTKVEFMSYLCMLHNQVNERLQKPISNCSEINKNGVKIVFAKVTVKKSITNSVRDKIDDIELQIN